MIRNTILCSIALHLVVACAIAWTCAPRFAKVEQVMAVQWVLDLKSDLRSEELGLDSNLAGKAGTAIAMPTESQRASTQLTELQKQSLPDESTIDRPLEPRSTATNPPRSASEGVSQDSMQMRPAFANTMNSQRLMVQVKQFFRMTNLSVLGMVEQALPDPQRKSLAGSTGTVTLLYRDGGIIDSLAIETDNATLQTLLTEKIHWSDVPAPRTYLLPYQKVTFSIAVSDDRIDVYVSPS